MPGQLTRKAISLQPEWLRDVPRRVGDRRLPADARVLFTGCRRNSASPGYTYMPDMAMPVSYDAYAPNPNTRDGQTLQSAGVAIEDVDED